MSRNQFRGKLPLLARRFPGWLLGRLAPGAEGVLVITANIRVGVNTSLVTDLGGQTIYPDFVIDC